jgi:hypothetical protein
MVGVFTRGRPLPFGGARTFPKSRRLEQMLIIERLLQPAASAIWDIVSDLLLIISRINSGCEAASRSAMMSCRRKGVDEMFRIRGVSLVGGTGTWFWPVRPEIQGPEWVL